MKLDDFIGNDKTITDITSWLNDYFDKKTKYRYCIVYGPSGCGKTVLGEILAKEYNIGLLHITPIDINSGNDMNDFDKSVNISSLDGSKYKLILIDDIKEFRQPYRNKLCNIGINGTSNNPIIYTTDNLSSFTLPEFTKNGLRLKLLRPITSEIYKYLKTLDSNIPDDILMKISKESQSVRSAVLSLYNSSVNELVHPTQTVRQRLSSIGNRKLRDNLDIVMNWHVIDSIRGYDSNALKVMNRFADFDWRLNKYRSITQYPQDDIDPFFINNMTEPIEKVKLEYRYIQQRFKVNHKKEKTIKSEPKKIEVKDTTTKQSAIDQWM